MGGVLSSRLKLVRDQTPNKPTFPGNITCFSYKSLKRATNNFRNRVRDDGFSSSYKGNLDDGSTVIVKVYSERYSDAEFSEEEVIRFTNVALSCVQSPSDLRPTMSDVRLMLSDNYDTSRLSLTRPGRPYELELSDVDVESVASSF
ncbi:unnamed protein product [Amaranthus hypochondriacus]